MRRKISLITLILHLLLLISFCSAVETYTVNGSSIGVRYTSGTDDEKMYQSSSGSYTIDTTNYANVNITGSQRVTFYGHTSDSHGLIRVGNLSINSPYVYIYNFGKTSAGVISLSSPYPGTADIHIPVTDPVSFVNYGYRAEVRTFRGIESGLVPWLYNPSIASLQFSNLTVGIRAHSTDDSMSIGELIARNTTFGTGTSIVTGSCSRIVLDNVDASESTFVNSGLRELHVDNSVIGIGPGSSVDYGFYGGSSLQPITANFSNSVIYGAGTVGAELVGNTGTVSFEKCTIHGIFLTFYDAEKVLNNSRVSFTNCTANGLNIYKNANISVEGGVYSGSPAFLSSNTTVKTGTIVDYGRSQSVVNIDPESSVDIQTTDDKTITTVKLSNPPVIIDWGDFPGLDLGADNHDYVISKIFASVAI